MLADEQDSIVGIDDDHARGEVGEVNDAVDAGTPVGTVDLVVPDSDPWVRVGLTPCVAAPRSDADGRLGSLRHRPPSSHGSGSRVVGPARAPILPSCPN